MAQKDAQIISEWLGEDGYKKMDAKNPPTPAIGTTFIEVNAYKTLKTDKYPYKRVSFGVSNGFVRFDSTRSREEWGS